MGIFFSCLLRGRAGDCLSRSEAVAVSTFLCCAERCFQPPNVSPLLLLVLLQQMRPIRIGSGVEVSERQQRRKNQHRGSSSSSCASSRSGIATVVLRFLCSLPMQIFTRGSRAYHAALVLQVRSLQDRNLCCCVALFTRKGSPTPSPDDKESACWDDCRCRGD